MSSDVLLLILGLPFTGHTAGPPSYGYTLQYTAQAAIIIAMADRRQKHKDRGPRGTPYLKYNYRYKSFAAVGFTHLISLRLSSPAQSAPIVFLSRFSATQLFFQISSSTRNDDNRQGRRGGRKSPQVACRNDDSCSECRCSELCTYFGPDRRSRHCQADSGNREAGEAESSSSYSRDSTRAEVLMIMHGCCRLSVRILPVAVKACAMRSRHVRKL